MHTAVRELALAAAPRYNARGYNMNMTTSCPEIFELRQVMTSSSHLTSPHLILSACFIIASHRAVAALTPRRRAPRAPVPALTDRPVIDLGQRFSGFSACRFKVCDRVRSFVICVQGGSRGPIPDT
jgi:hypothetical protein